MAKCAALFQSLKEYPDDFERAGEAYYSWENERVRFAKEKLILHVKKEIIANKKEIIANKKGNARAIIRIDVETGNIEVFPTVSLASQENKIDKKTISRAAASGNAYRGGFYLYADDI